jgi:DNA-binding transcriptional ArsR family regulator
MALLHPLRQQLLLALGQPQSAAALSRAMEIPRQLLTYHLRTLESLLLIEFVEERAVRQMKERVYIRVAKRFVLDPSLLGDLGPRADGLTDPTSATQLAGLFQAAAGEALAAEAPTLALCYDMGFVARDERNDAFQSIANTAQRIARLHVPQGTEERYRLVVGVIRPPA